MGGNEKLIKSFDCSLYYQNKSLYLGKLFIYTKKLCFQSGFNNIYVYKDINVVIEAEEIDQVIKIENGLKITTKNLMEFIFV